MGKPSYICASSVKIHENMGVQSFHNKLLLLLSRLNCLQVKSVFKGCPWGTLGTRSNEIAGTCVVSKRKFCQKLHPFESVPVI